MVKGLGRGTYGLEGPGLEVWGLDYITGMYINVDVDTAWTRSECSTLVRNTVVRAIYSPSLGPMANGEFRLPPGRRNCWTDWDETWHGWLRRWPHPTCTKRKVYVKGVVWGGGEIFTPSVFFFSFGSLNGPPAYPVRMAGRSVHPKTCFGGKLIPRGWNSPKVQRPHFMG